MFLFKNIITIDKKYLYHNLSCNKKNVTFFFYNRKIHLINNLTFKKHNSYQCWTYFYSRLFGFNKNISSYFLSFIGYNKNIIFTNSDEYFFLFFKSFLKFYSDYFSLSWFLTYLKQRAYLLPLLSKGYRFFKKYPSRGQRTRSNFRNSKKRIDKNTYFSVKKKLTNHYKYIHYPSWKEINSFYFHSY